MRHLNKICLALICAAIFTFPTKLLLAQEKHGHEAPHGGIVTTVGNYHLEMVVVDTSKAVQIYLLDSKEKTMPTNGITGNVTFLFPDKTKEKVDLMVHEDYFMAAMDSSKLDEFTAVVVLKIKGKSQIGRFKYEATNKEEHHGEKEDHHEKKEDHHGEKEEHHEKKKPKGKQNY